jgi:adrenodoxin-NADP+ reductase
MFNEVVNRWICSRCATSLSKKGSFARPVQSTRIARYSSAVSSRNGRPFRMAVIGSGPAGFYTSYKVMSKIENSVVDMYEHLPIPFGLVRFGVAPDHPEVKVENL